MTQRLFSETRPVGSYDFAEVEAEFWAGMAQAYRLWKVTYMDELPDSKELEEPSDSEPDASEQSEEEPEPDDTEGEEVKI